MIGMTEETKSVEDAQNALADARRDGNPQAIKVAQQGLVNAQAEQHQGKATLDQQRERQGFQPSAIVDAHDSLMADAADNEAADDHLYECGFLVDGDECADDRLVFRVGVPARGLDALIPPKPEYVCGLHLPAVLVDQNYEDNRAWSVTVVAEPS